MTIELTKGKLITIEGSDGAGKTTQIAYLEEYLIAKGYDVVRIREPGGTEVGEKIRDILLHCDMDPMTELMLFTSSRMEIITKKILPSLRLGKVVLADRFIDSTFAYQGCGRNLRHCVVYLEQLVREYVNIDHTLYFDVSQETSEKRMKDSGKTLDRLDSESSLFKQKVRQGFQERAVKESDRIVEFNAEGSVQSVRQQVEKWIDRVFIPSTQQLRKTSKG